MNQNGSCRGYFYVTDIMQGGAQVLLSQHMSPSHACDVQID